MAGSAGSAAAASVMEGAVVGSAAVAAMTAAAERGKAATGAQGTRGVVRRTRRC